MKTPPKKFLLTFGVCLILFFALTQVPIKPVFGATIYVYPGQSIQAAELAASPGDTIIVMPGTYVEHVVVGKSLTIAGYNSATTIIDGNATGTIFRLDASDVVIANFTLRNAGDGNNAIRSERLNPTNDDHIIKDNIITTSKYGISLGDSNRNTIQNNTFFDNPFGGISLGDSNNNNISDNTISESLNGIEITASNGNTIENNTITQTSDGIYLFPGSSGNFILYNTITFGLYTGIISDSTTSINTIHHNTITQSAYGIYLFNSRNQVIYYNNLANNSRAIRINGPSGINGQHSIDNNKIVDNDYGMEIVAARGNNPFTGNWIEDNTYGVYLSGSITHTFYHNNFIRNPFPAFQDSSNNAWSQGGQGNHWSDYNGKDDGTGGRTAGDGIGDTNIPYLGIDNFPLMYTWSEHDISIQNVTTSTNTVYQGAIIDITVTVKNIANTTATETFTVTAKYNISTIGTQQVQNLAQGATAIRTFNWNTAGVPLGNYTISAQTSTITDELRTDNNNFIDGTIKIKILLPGDINQDDTVNLTDLILLQQAYGSTAGPPPSPNWNPDADINKDNKINLTDLAQLSENYNRTT